jgi:ATP-binding cassette subfamily B protein
MREGQTLTRLVRHLPRFLAFVYRHFPMARIALVMTLLATCIEYATFSLMLPLSGQIGGKTGAIVSQAWTALASSVGLQPTPRTWLWFFLLLLAFRTALEYGLVWTNTRLSKQVQATLSNSIFTQVLQREPLADIYTRTIGHYIALAGEDTSKAGSIILYFGQLTSAVLDAIAGLVLLFAFSPLVFGATLGFGLVSGLFVLVLMRRLVRWNAASAFQSRTLNTYGLDALNGVRSLRSMAAEPYVVHRYREMMRTYLGSLFTSELVKQAMKTGPALFLLAVGIAWSWPGMPLANQDRDPLFFVGMVMLLVRVFVAMGTVVTKGERLVTDVRAVHDIDELIELHVPAAGADANRPPLDHIHSIALHGVAYRYRGGMQDVVAGVDIEFDAGRSYALMGASGGGKSTLADVMLGLLPASAGRVEVNGIALDRYDLPALRQRAILVEQQTRIFTGSLRENILLGHSASDADLAEAIAIAELSDYVHSRPGGVDFVLEYQGANLSGGQRQRVGIARALVRRPDVLVLDEATSALDQDSRARLIDSVRAAMREKILVLITHDPEVARCADETWLVADGAVSARSAG